MRRFFLLLVAASSAPIADAMGLRSFVALPVDKGGKIGRLQFERNVDQGLDRLLLNFAYGINAKQTLLLGLPYHLSRRAAEDRLGDVSVLFRQIVWQIDRPASTRRLGWLGGVVLPTDSDRDGAIQAGLVTTFYHARHEWDLDLLFRPGLNDRPDSAQYDVSWQYRLAPADYPDWGIPAEWNGIVELGGRWHEDENTVHQFTLGIQWINPRWILEGGVIQDLNGPQDTQVLLSTRIHF